MLRSLQCCFALLLLLISSSCTSKSIPSYLTAGLIDFEPPVVQSSRVAKSEIHLLTENEEAFHAILALADVAKRHIEVQYYLFFKDKTGLMLRERLIQAANRGVKVRILVDDMGLKAVNNEMRLLNAHPNIEVRLFNPFGGKWLGPTRVLTWLRSPLQIGRRMHNKLFAVDEKWLVTGGRNVGDHYFKSSTDSYFKDLDVLARGQLAKDAMVMFERYWSCEVAVPVENYLSGVRRFNDEQELSLWQKDIASDKKLQNFLNAYRTSGWKTKIERDQVGWIRTPAKLIYDEPQKILKLANQSDHLLMGAELTYLAKNSSKELIIVSPYFVPADEGVEFLREIRKQGVRVILLTNSLATNDVALVHGAYAKYRQRLLAAGIEIYELKPDALLRKNWKRTNPSSRASLHAKTFVFDAKTVFIGSFNVDPRSANLNTEMGILAEHPQLANQVRSLVEEATRPSASYKLSLNAKKEVQWSTVVNGTVKVYDDEPECTWKSKLGIFWVHLLPIESQL